MKRCIFVGCVSLMLGCAVHARAADDKVKTLERTIRSHQSMRSRLERKRSSVASKLIKQETQVAGQLMKMDAVRRDLNDIEAEISEVNTVIHRLSQQESDLLSRLKDDHFGVRRDGDDNDRGPSRREPRRSQDIRETIALFKRKGTL